MKLTDYSTAIIILAAGRGQRMGLEHGSKLLLPLAGGEPIITHAIRNASALEPAELVVVIRPDSPDLEGEVIEARSFAPDLKSVINLHYEQGMATSIAAGVRSLSEEVEAALVMLADMPTTTPHIVEALMTAYTNERKPITIPQYGGVVGPPTLFARPAFPDLLTLQGEVGGRQLLKLYPDWVCLVQFEADDRPIDLDTPEDIARFRETETRITW